MYPRSYYSIPIVFLFIAGGLGLFLRWQFLLPTPGIRYTYFLHAHSHLMFLGWVFNILFLAFTEHHLAVRKMRQYAIFFGALQLLVVAMAISFPIQGYGVWSIIFSTLHTLAIMAFVPIFFVRAKGDTTVSAWFARAAWIFFTISTAGPFSLGYLMANGMGNSVWYNFSIYYYLHFQYNGFFIFGILSLFFHLLESRKIPFSRRAALRFGKWTAFACVPAYTLSVLFAKPGLLFNWIGLLAATGQLIALGYFAQHVFRIRADLSRHFRPHVMILFKFAAVSFVAKNILQVVSAHSEVASMAYSMRPIVIGYLHLVLVGVVTFFLLGWYFDRQLLHYKRAKAGIPLLVAGFLGSELCLVLLPWWSQLGIMTSPSLWIFVFSALMFVGFSVVLVSVNIRPDKNHSIS